MKSPRPAVLRCASCLFAVFFCWQYFGCQAAGVTAGKIYLKDGEFAMASQSLEKAIAAAPHNAELHFLLGKAYAGYGEYAKASAAFERSLQLEETYAEQIDQERQRYFVTEHNRGVELIGAGDEAQFAAAASAFRKATAIDPSAPEGWRNLGYVFFELDRLDSAAHAYGMATRADARDQGTWLNLGTIEMAAGNNDKALAALTRLLELNADHAAGLQGLATLYERLGRPAMAIETYGRLIAVTPDNPLAHYNLGNLYWKSELYDQAIEAYESALNIESNDEDALFNQAVTYVAKGELDTALPQLQSLSLRMPESPLVWRELGRIYAAKGMADASRDAFARETALSAHGESGR